jgi:cell division septation protein DedD
MAAKNRRVLELKLGKLGLILFIGGMSLLLFSMFLLGILVGKHMEAYPERFSPGVVELIRDRLFASGPQTIKPTPSAEAGKRDSPAGGEESFGLTFYETLGGKKTGAAANTAGAVKDETPEASAPMTVPAGKPATPGLAAGGDGIPGEGRFEIQVAAYQDSRIAEKTMEKLKPLGFASRVVMKDLPGKGKWFRVIVGGFENREKAKTAADQIDGKVRGVKCVVRPSGNNGGN